MKGKKKSNWKGKINEIAIVSRRSNRVHIINYTIIWRNGI